MGIISWIILGIIAGFIGSKIVNKTGQGMIMDIVLGIVGAIVGGVIFSAFGAQGVTGLNIWSLIVAVVGSVVVLWAYHQISGKRSPQGQESRSRPGCWRSTLPGRPRLVSVVRRPWPIGASFRRARRSPGRWP